MRVTMSKLALLSSCQYWAREGVQWSHSASPEATFGTALHALCDAYIRGEPLPTTEDMALAAVWEHVRAYIDTNKRTGWLPEVAFAYDVKAGTARQLHASSGHRDYSSSTLTEVCGTADLVYMGADDSGVFACVDDWKHSGFHGDEAKAQAQLGGLALCVARAWGVDRVRARALRISDDGVDDTSEVYWLDAFDLEAMASDLRERIKDTIGAEPAPGPHCAERWCPAIASCPATTKAIEQVIPATHLVREHRLSVDITTPEHAAWSLAAVEMVEEGVKQIKAKLREYADANGGIHLGDGRVWAASEVVTERADLSQPGAVQELQALGVGNAIEASVAWSAIKRIGGAAKEEQARAALRAIGATKTSSHPRYEARGKKRGRAA